MLYFRHVRFVILLGKQDWKCNGYLCGSISRAFIHTEKRETDALNHAGTRYRCCPLQNRSTITNKHL